MCIDEDIAIILIPCELIYRLSPNKIPESYIIGINNMIVMISCKYKFKIFNTILKNKVKSFLVIILRIITSH